MKDLFRLFRRFLPPYKGRVVLNFVFNLLSAIFTAFSFGLLSPILGILFGTDQPVRELVPWEMTIDSLKNNAAYFLTWVIDTYGQSSALIYIGVFVVVMVLLKVLFMYMASLMMMDIRNSVVRDIRALIYNKLIALPLGFFSDERKGDIMARMTSDVQEIA